MIPPQSKKQYIRNGNQETDFFFYSIICTVVHVCTRPGVVPGHLHVCAYEQVIICQYIHYPLSSFEWRQVVPGRTMTACQILYELSWDCMSWSWAAANFGNCQIFVELESTAAALGSVICTYVHMYK